MAEQFTEQEKNILSYISRGISKQSAAEKIALFFNMKTFDVNPVIEKLKRGGFVIESKGVAGVTVYMTSPLKVKPAMLDERIIERLKEAEQGGKAAGFKRKTFTTDVDTGEIVEATKKKKIVKKQADLGFDVV